MMLTASPSLSFFFFNDTATTEIYTLPLHDALPIYAQQMGYARSKLVAERLCQHAERAGLDARVEARPLRMLAERSEEHTSELQSPDHLVCRLLLEKKKKSLSRRSRSTASHKTQMHT